MRGNLSGIKRALRSRLLTKSKATSQSENERDPLCDREYDPKMGYFYTCPACYRRYVSSEDVEEHLNTCSMQLMPEEKSSTTPTILSVSSLSKASSLSQASSEDGNDSVLIRMLNDIKAIRSEPEGSGLNGQDSGLSNAGDSRPIQTEDSRLINGQDSSLIDANEIVQGNSTDQVVADDTEDLLPFAFQHYFNNQEDHQPIQQIQPHTISVIPEARINPPINSLCSANQTLYQLNGRGNGEEDMDFDYHRDPAIESSYGGFNCPTCDGYFETIEGLQTHVSICIASPAAPYQPSIIPSQPLQSQLQLTSLPPSTPVMTYFEDIGWTQMFPCIPCKKAFKTSQELSAHNESTHMSGFPVCGVCNKVFSSKRALANHAIVHSDDKPHQCRLCPMAFKHKNTLRSHELVHEETPAARCTFPGCGASFRNIWTLRRHRQAHRNGVPIAHREESTVRPEGQSTGHPEGPSTGHPEGPSTGHPEGPATGHPEGPSTGHPEGALLGHPEGASKEPELGQAYKPAAAKKKPRRRPRRRRSESPDPPSPVEVITIE